MQPLLRVRTKTFSEKICPRCGNHLGPEDFAPTKSWFYPDGVLPICDECCAQYLEEKDFRWDVVDKFCQWADIPFVPKEFERLHEANGRKVFHTYAAVFLSEEYASFGWEDYNEEFRKLRSKGLLEFEIPLVGEEKLRKLREKWGSNYDTDDLLYLENLYNGLLSTQNINGALQSDQALKICKISCELDRRIRDGEDFDKLLKSYDTLVKAAEFTPKNTKNINDFDSVGELFSWLEKRGWKNKYFDNVSKGVVDETMKNIQAFNQKLYTNETGIGDEITRRIEALQNAKKAEDRYDTGGEYALEDYELDGYDKLLNADEEEFESDLGGA